MTNEDLIQEAMACSRRLQVQAAEPYTNVFVKVADINTAARLLVSLANALRRYGERR